MSFLGSGGQVTISPPRSAGEYCKDTTPRYTLNFDGGDWMTLPAKTGSKSYIEFDLLMPALGSDGTYILSLLGAGGSGFYIQIDGADPLLYIWMMNDALQLKSFATIDWAANFGVYHRIRINKSGTSMALLIDEVEVQTITCGTFTLNNLDTNFIGTDTTNTLTVPSGTKIKNMSGFFIWNSFFTDDAHTVALADGQNAATIYDYENNAYWSQTTVGARPSVTITIGG